VRAIRQVLCARPPVRQVGRATVELPASSYPRPCIVPTGVPGRGDTPSDRHASHHWKVGTRTDNSSCHGNRQLRRARTVATTNRWELFSNRRGTTAGHISPRPTAEVAEPRSTCGFTAPGVGLEPTTYGLTERPPAYADIRGRTPPLRLPCSRAICRPPTCADVCLRPRTVVAKRWPSTRHANQSAEETPTPGGSREPVTLATRL
jgi:hypothetical protein